MSKKSLSTAAEIEAFIQAHPDWSYIEDALIAHYDCGTFEDAVSKINQTAQVFSELDHHPTIENTYSKLSFTLTTHDAGDRVTDIDLAVAKRISAVMSDLD